jgi:Kef-type K+ transport system membrane component KefB/nucleotide-binding universal stress UspA family protein
LLLIIILLTPIILNKLKIPQIIGLIIAGAIIGENGFDLIIREGSIELFGKVGILYIMFLAGLEIDMGDFKKNSAKSIVFGLYTFIIPMAIGTAVGMYILQFSIFTSLLMASMFASHTLITYPIVSKLGITKNTAVNITVGGTVITDTLALLVLAVVVGLSTGEITDEFWIRLGVSVLVFGLVVMLIFPLIGRWFFKNFDDNISQYLFALGMVYLGALLAEAAGIEDIIGAFLAGLALNRLIPHTSPLMNRIEFVGNALFIPFFLIGVGMMIDFRAFFSDFETIKVAVVMSIVAIVSKWSAAWLTQKSFRFSVDERRIIFGLSNAQAAATLAVVLVGYNITLDDGERLLGESILNGTILMILVTCTVASLVTQKAASNLAKADLDETISETNQDNNEKILIPISNEETVSALVNLSITIKSKSNKKDLFALNVINNENKNESSEKQANKILEKARKIASSTDNTINDLVRYDINIINGINSVVKENNITDIIMGLHSKSNATNSFLGNLTKGILKKCNTTTLIYKEYQPLSTIKRHLVIIPPNAEKEIGFPFWLVKIWNIGRNTGSVIEFYADKSTTKILEQLNKKNAIECKFNEFENWDDFLILSRDITKDDDLIIILSRKDYLSYNPVMAKIPRYLDDYFNEINFTLVYPIQAGINEKSSIQFNNPSVLGTIQENVGRLDDLGKNLIKIFKSDK